MTEVTAGSGLYGPTLFDPYRAFDVRPAALFALPVVRKPSPSIATVLGGGYMASGAGGADRLPRPVLPAGLRLDRAEGAGEVQTPVLGPAARDLALGDRVWFRHAKAGELCERFAALHLVAARRSSTRWPPTAERDRPSCEHRRREARGGRGRSDAGGGRDVRRPGHRLDRALSAARAGRSAACACAAWPPRRPPSGWPRAGAAVEPFEALDALDIAIDGADQVAPDGWVIKGGGGAHTREKVVAAAAARFVIIASSDKVVERSGRPCRSSC